MILSRRSFLKMAVCCCSAMVPMGNESPQCVAIITLAAFILHRIMIKYRIE